jgi:hypothetical protein
MTDLIQKNIRLRPADVKAVERIKTLAGLPSDSAVIRYALQQTLKRLEKP